MQFEVCLLVSLTRSNEGFEETDGVDADAIPYLDPLLTFPGPNVDVDPS